MASIKLTDLETSGDMAITNIATSEAGVGPMKKFTFADMKMDLEIGEVLTNIPIGNTKNKRDARALYDVEAIKSSVENIFNTTPGEKILNPTLGIDLKKFLFSPMTERTARDIANTIVRGLNRQEPRVTVTKISVHGARDENTYYITFVLGLPHLKAAEIIADGKLNSSGFSFVANNEAFQIKKIEYRDSTWDFDQEN